MSDIKEFTFGNGGEPVEVDNLKIAGTFVLNKEKFTVAYQETANLALLVAAINNAGNDGIKTVAKVVDFMDRALVPGDALRFEKTVLDAQMKVEDVVSIFQHVLELTAADPTTGASSV